MMPSTPTKPAARLAPLVFAWFVLVTLTLVSLGLGEWLRGVSWLPVLAAAIIWLKAWLVAYYFLEVPQCHTLIRRLVWIFIAFVPITLVFTDLFGRQIAALLQV